VALAGCLLLAVFTPPDPTPTDTDVPPTSLVSASVASTEVEEQEIEPEAVVSAEEPPPPAPAMMAEGIDVEPPPAMAVRSSHGCDAAAELLCTQEPPPPDPWPDIPGTPSDDTWDRIAQCESNGNWAIATGNGYYGGVQFGLTGWRATGGSGYPSDASRDEQIYRADKLWLMQGWPAWPACSRKLGLR